LAQVHIGENKVHAAVWQGQRQAVSRSEFQVAERLQHYSLLLKKNQPSPKIGFFYPLMALYVTYLTMFNYSQAGK
jgi:hypothetical protein